MERKELNILAEKFWEGNCSESEEKFLRDYLRWNDDIPSEFYDLRDYLSMMNADTEGLSLDFDQKVLSTIDSSSSRRRLDLKRLYPIAGVAVILFGIFIVTQLGDSDPVEPVAQEIDTYEDPEKAYEEVKKALMMVSGKMNKGKKYSNELGKFSIAAGQVQAQEN